MKKFSIVILTLTVFCCVQSVTANSNEGHHLNNTHTGNRESAIAISLMSSLGLREQSQS